MNYPRPHLIAQSPKVRKVAKVAAVASPRVEHFGFVSVAVIEVFNLHFMFYSVSVLLLLSGVFALARDVGQMIAELEA